MSDQLPRRITYFAPWRWQRRWIAPVMLSLAIVGYPLSIGPVYGLMLQGWLPASVFQLVYWPIIWCAEMHPAIYDVMEDYTMMFAPY